MTIHFTSMTVSQITERAHKLMDEGCALANLAAALAEFETATGRKLFVSEADQGTSYVGQGGPELEFTGTKRTTAEVGKPVQEAAELGPSQLDGGLTVSRLAVRIDTGIDPLAVAEPNKKETPAVSAPVAAKQARNQEPIKKAGSATVARPPVKEAPTATRSATDRPWGALSLPARRIVQHLEKLPRTFTPAEDLTIVEMLVHGNKVEQVAALVEMPADAVLTRWKGFLCSDVLGPNGKPSIDGQQQLLAALRYRKDNPNA